MAAPDPVDGKEVLRDLLRGYGMIYPFMAFGMLGGDPNDFTLDEHVRIVGWLEALGYRRRVRSRFQHAHAMSVWVRDDDWPGERFEDRKPYTGIPLRVDPELHETRAERAERRREWRRMLDELE